MRVLAATIACCLALSLGSDGARAQEEPAPLHAQLGLSGNTVTASFDITGAFTEAFRKRLSGGLTSRVLIEIELEDASGSPIATEVRACQLRLDIWDDVFYVAVTDAERTRRKTFALTDESVKACGIVDKTPIADATLLVRQTGYRLNVRVALNPVSPEVLDRTREFMANPHGTEGRPRAFFGAVAKLFRSEASSGGERFVFQSQPLSRPTKESP
jgi:uncharacterized protein DUF4390